MLTAETFARQAGPDGPEDFDQHPQYRDTARQQVSPRVRQTHGEHELHILCRIALTHISPDQPPGTRLHSPVFRVYWPQLSSGHWPSPSHDPGFP